MVDTIRISIIEATALVTVAVRGVGVADPLAACVARALVAVRVGHLLNDILVMDGARRSWPREAIPQADARDLNKPAAFIVQAGELAGAA